MTYEFTRNKIFKCIAMLLVCCILLSQTSVFAAVDDCGNIAPSISSLSLSKQRKVTIQIDQGTYAQPASTVQSKIYSILKPKLEAQNIEVDVRLRSIATIDTVVNSTSFSDDSENYYVSLNNSTYPEFSDAAKAAQILNLFVEKQVAFIGVGTSGNKSIIESFIAKNQNIGIFIDNSNLDAAISRIVNYILGRTTTSLDLFVGDGVNQDRDILRTKINTMVKPKLAAANINADINIKMLSSHTFTTPYYVNYYTGELYVYKNNVWQPEYKSDLFINKNHNYYPRYDISYDNKLYFVCCDANNSQNNKLYYYDFSTKTIKLCSNTNGAMYFTVASDGKVYWSADFCDTSTNYYYSKIYAYDPITDNNTYITETHVTSAFLGKQIGPCNRVIISLAMSLDLKLVYSTTMSRYDPYTITYSTGYILGCYDVKNKKFLLPENDRNDYIEFGNWGRIVILSDNTVIIPTLPPKNPDADRQYSDVQVTHINTFNINNPLGYTRLTSLNTTAMLIGANQTLRSMNDTFIFKYNNNVITSNDMSIIKKTDNYSYWYHGVMSNGELYCLPSEFGCEAPQYPLINVPLTKSLDTVLNDSTFDDTKDSYVAYLGDTTLPELNDSTKKSSIVTQIKNSGTKFVGLGTATNKAQFNDLITLNNNQGAVYDNSNLDTAMNNLADYIISSTKKPNQNVSSYIVVSEGTETLETQEGALDTNGLPAYSDTLKRSNDYFDVTGGNSYTFTFSEAVNAFNIYWYDSTLKLISKNNYSQPPTNLIAPSEATYAKIVYGSSHSNVDIAVTNNTEANGDNVAYSSGVYDYENDTVDYLYKYNHDPYKIAGVTIDNPTDKIMFNNLDISIPVKKFTKPGTYTISLFAKDKPKLIDDSANVLINGDAETVDSTGKLPDWSSWSANPSITTFTRAVSQELKISGNGSFEIFTDQVTDGSNNAACYFKDVVVSPNTNYILSGLLKTQNCTANFDIYELDSNYNILNTLSSSNINSTTPQSSSICLTTKSNTKMLRIYISKGKTTNVVADSKDYIVADDITLSKVLSDARFEEYRKLSNPATKTIYAHRIPKANFSYKVGTRSNGSFYVTNLADNGLSYDPDHSSRADKGIIDSQWKWAQVSTDGTVTWHDGKLPSTLDFLPGSQILLWYKVRDIDGPGGKGAWSKPKMQRIDGKLADPVAMFIPNPNPLPMQNEIELADQSYSRNVNGVITKRVWTIRKAGETTVKTLTFGREDNVNNKYYKRFTSLGFGKYTITLTVTDNYGKVSKPYSRVINVIDTINPTVGVDKNEGEFKDGNGAVINVTCKDSTQSASYNRGLKTINYVWSKSATEPLITDDVQTITIPIEKTYTKKFETSKKEDGTWYLYIKDMDYAGNTNNNGDYVKFGPYKVETLKAGHFYITMMLDIGWRSYYFDINNGIDDNHDGEVDRYPRRTNTDIGTLKMPINYYNLVGHDRTYIKAGYKVKGKIDIIGNPDYAEFRINYVKEGKTYTDIVPLSKSTGDTYTFEWVIPLETDSKSFVSFDLVTKKGNKTYGNEKWVDDTWDSRNTSRLVFYVKGKATDDLTYVQSQ